MKITVVGCSGSFPGPTGPASCYLVEADGYRVRARPRQRRGRRPAAVPRPGRPRRGAHQPPAPRPLHRPAGALRRPHLRPAAPVPPDPGLRAQRRADDHLARAYGKGEAGGLDLVVRLRRVDGGRPQGRAAAGDGRPDGAPGRDLGDAGRARRQGAGLLRRHRSVRRLVELARDADLALFEAAFEEGRDDHGPKDLHLTAGDAGQAATAAGVAAAGPHPPAAVERPRGRAA